MKPYNTNIAQLNNNVKPLQLKTYSALNIHALQNNSEKFLKLFYELRYINDEHNGDIPFDEALEKLQRVFHYPIATLYKRLTTNEYFTITFNAYENKKYIHLISLLKIAPVFTTDYLTRPIILEVKGKLSLPQFKAFLYATFHKTANYPKEFSPISRQRLQEKTGVNIRTQQRYDKVANIKKIPNYSNKIVEYAGKNRTWKTSKQLPNSYYNSFDRGNRGVIKTINQLLKSSLSCYDEVTAKGTLKATRYFNTANQFLKAKFRETETFLKFKKTQNYNLWETC